MPSTLYLCGAQFGLARIVRGAAPRTARRPVASTGVRGLTIAALVVLAAGCAPTTTHCCAREVPGVTRPLEADQTELTGIVTTLTGKQIAGPVLPLPVTLQVVRGGGTKARFEGGMIGGTHVTVTWDGGRPLPITGQGSIDLLGPADIDVTKAGVGWHLDGSTRSLTAGRYRLGAAVAVVTTGLGEPRDGVELVGPAGVTTNGGVTITVPPADTTLAGPGELKIEGDLDVRNPAGTRHSSHVTFGPGPFTLTLRPRADGRYDIVRALLQGPATITG
jgi:hypothetical protein